MIIYKVMMGEARCSRYVDLGSSCDLIGRPQCLFVSRVAGLCTAALFLSSIRSASWTAQTRPLHGITIDLHILVHGCRQAWDLIDQT
jgi:hypothetical protein